MLKFVLVKLDISFVITNGDNAAFFCWLSPQSGTSRSRCPPIPRLWPGLMSGAQWGGGWAGFSRVSQTGAAAWRGARWRTPKIWKQIDKMLKAIEWGKYSYPNTEIDQNQVGILSLTEISWVQILWQAVSDFRCMADMELPLWCGVSDLFFFFKCDGCFG